MIMEEKKARILLCEDDQNLGLVLKNYLELNDFDVVLERDGRFHLGFSDADYSALFDQ